MQGFQYQSITGLLRTQLDGMVKEYKLGFKNMQETITFKVFETECLRMFKIHAARKLIESNPDFSANKYRSPNDLGMSGKSGFRATLTNDINDEPKDESEEDKESNDGDGAATDEEFYVSQNDMHKLTPFKQLTPLKQGG